MVCDWHPDDEQQGVVQMSVGIGIVCDGHLVSSNKVWYDICLKFWCLGIVCDGHPGVKEQDPVITQSQDVVSRNGMWWTPWCQGTRSSNTAVPWCGVYEWYVMDTLVTRNKVQYNCCTLLWCPGMVCDGHPGDEEQGSVWLLYIIMVSRNGMWWTPWWRGTRSSMTAALSPTQMSPLPSSSSAGHPCTGIMYCTRLGLIVLYKKDLKIPSALSLPHLIIYSLQWTSISF
jgi:hypothetical protein